MIDLIVDTPRYTIEELSRGDYLVTDNANSYGTFDSIRDARKYMNLLTKDFEEQLPYGNMRRNFKITIIDN